MNWTQRVLSVRNVLKKEIIRVTKFGSSEMSVAAAIVEILMLGAKMDSALTTKDMLLQVRFYWNNYPCI